LRGTFTVVNSGMGKELLHQFWDIRTRKPFGVEKYLWNTIGAKTKKHRDRPRAERTWVMGPREISVTAPTGHDEIAQGKAKRSPGYWYPCLRYAA
jgi:hypothetical protein